VPPWQINPNYQHIFALPRDQKLTLNVEALYRSPYQIADLTRAYINAGLVPYFTNNNIIQENVTLTYNFLPQVTLSAYVRNVSNQVYKFGGGATTATASNNTGNLSAPRTYGGVLSVRF
jgi:iron complex outermembrane receptor protein